MILERLVLHNFGPYLGRHEIDLSPSPPKRPVILFGGLNGGGKTSILSALQLVLFGRQSVVWKNAENSYDAYLRKCIHRRADATEGAGIELTFRSAGQGSEQTIHLCRYWRTSGTSVRESLDVIRDGELDTVLAENWADWVEEFIPARVAPLFFFDGERVEELANPEHSREILQSAIHSLLGLDIVDQLHSDLEILERRKRKESGNGKEETPLTQREKDFEREVERLNARLSERHQEQAALQNDVDRLIKRLSELERQLANQGGSIFENRHQIESEREQVLTAMTELEEQLRQVAAGGLPLAVVLPMIEEIEQATRASQQFSVQATVLELLQERDLAVLDRIRSLRGSKTLLAGVQSFLEEDRSGRAQPGANTTPLLDPSGMARIHALQMHVLPMELARAEAVLKKLGELEIQIQTADRKLAGLPDEERILPLLQERDQVREKLADQQRAQEVNKELLRVESAEHERAKKSLDATRQEVAESLLDGEDAARLLRHSLRARDTLQRFRTKVLESHVRRIERLALECFSSLMRKQHLVRDLRIDHETFAVELHGEDGHIVPPEKLSAGERQLLAIAILWALGRASGRPLPTVIDTPLGRLDGTHRKNLVDRYFPFASHQVVLLSTDEEIDERFYRDLQPHLARSYLLDCDDKKQMTNVRDGYFWEATA